MKKLIKKVVVVSLLGAVLSSLLIEVVLRALHYPRGDCAKLTELGENSVAQYDPELGWVYTPGKSAPADYGITYTFSSEGYRSDRLDKKTDFSKPRIVIVGDSLLFGHALPFKETFGYKLQMKLRDRYEVLNFAVQAYGTDQMYLTLKRVLPTYRPQFVITDYAPDHPVRNVNRDRRDFYPCARVIGTKPVFGVRNEKLVLLHKPLLYREYDTPRTLLAIRRILEGNLTSRTEKYGDTVTRALLEEMNRIVKNYNAKLYRLDFGAQPPLMDNATGDFSQILGVTIDLEASGSNHLIISNTDHHPNASGTSVMVDTFITEYGRDF